VCYSQAEIRLYTSNYYPLFLGNTSNCSIQFNATPASGKLLVNATYVFVINAYKNQYMGMSTFQMNSTNQVVTFDIKPDPDLFTVKFKLIDSYFMKNAVAVKGYLEQGTVNITSFSNLDGDMIFFSNSTTRLQPGLAKLTISTNQRFNETSKVFSLIKDKAFIMQIDPFKAIKLNFTD
jgi:hypothetical protein